MLFVCPFYPKFPCLENFYILGAQKRTFSLFLAKII